MDLPASEEKDSSYVAYQMKNKWGANGLSVTIHPPLSYDLGNKNLENFIFSGYDNIRITPNPEVGRKMARYYFGNSRPTFNGMDNERTNNCFEGSRKFQYSIYHVWRRRRNRIWRNIKIKNKFFYDLDECIDLYFSGNKPDDFLSEYSKEETFWWTLPSKEKFKKLNPIISKYSFFENWDSYEHYLVAKEKCGMLEEEGRCIGTYNNFAQTDTKLYDLHVYLMFLKFGFGRCTQDLGIDIRRGALSRKTSNISCEMYDGEYPEKLIPEYLEYFQMSQKEFDNVIDKFANKKILEKRKGRWQLKNKIV